MSAWAWLRRIFAGPPAPPPAVPRRRPACAKRRILEAHATPDMEAAAWLSTAGWWGRLSPEMRTKAAWLCPCACGGYEGCQYAIQPCRCALCASGGWCGHPDEDIAAAEPGSLIAGERVITPPGAAIQVTEIELTEEGRRGLTTDLDRLPPVK